MEKAKRILIAGSSDMDITMCMDKMPAPGETSVGGEGIYYTPGGFGAGAAIAFSRLGAESIFCTKLGADAHGHKLYEYYRECGLNTSQIYADKEAKTGVRAIMREADGSTRRVIFRGANANFRPENLSPAIATQPDALYTCLEIPFETVRAAAAEASGRGIPVVIDAAPATKDMDLSTLSGVEIFSPNETEAEILTGIRPAGAESCLRAALALSRIVKCRYVVIKLGARGSYIYDRKHYMLIAPARPDKTVDTDGVGDAFTAALTLEYLRTGDIKTAAVYASAAAAVAISRAGAIESLPTDDEVRAYLAKH